MRIEYGTARIKDLSCRVEATKNRGPQVIEVHLDGRPCQPSDRFWTSLQARFGFSKNIFRYFTHQEVFNRISAVAPNDRVRYAVEREDNGGTRLLAVTSPTAPYIPYADLMGLLSRYDGEDISYDEGVVRSRHTPRVGANDAVISGDAFANRFVLDVPVDGFGRPSAYLSLLRLICQNGAVAFSPAFRSEIGVGRGEDGIEFPLIRALESFGNEEGFAALRQRFEAATSSWASIHEANRLYRTLVRLHHARAIQNAPVMASGGDGAEELPGGCLRSPVLESFNRVAGDLAGTYGLANLDTLSVKRQRTLPTKAKVFDLINFATETATHHATDGGNRMLQGFLGELVTSEYDLEGLGQHFTDYQDFFVEDQGSR